MSESENDDLMAALLRSAELKLAAPVDLPAGWAVAGRAKVRPDWEGNLSPPQPELEKSEMLAVVARCCSFSWRGVLHLAAALAYASRASRLARSLAGTLAVANALLGRSGAVLRVFFEPGSPATVSPESADATKWSVVSFFRIWAREGRTGSYLGQGESKSGDRNGDAGGGRGTGLKKVQRHSSETQGCSSSGLELQRKHAGRT